MARPERWWRPSTTRRPAQRARARRMYSGSELDNTFEVGFECGKVDERKRHEQLEGGLRRLMDAIRESENGDPRPLDDLAREAGVMPADDAERLVDDLERWLREQDD